MWLVGTKDQINTAKTEHLTWRLSFEKQFKDQLFVTAAAMKFCLDEWMPRKVYVLTAMKIIGNTSFQ